MVVSVCLNVEGSLTYLRVNAMRICFEYVTQTIAPYTAAFLSSFCCSLALRLTKEEQTIAPLLIFVFLFLCWSSCGICNNNAGDDGGEARLLSGIRARWVLNQWRIRRIWKGYIYENGYSKLLIVQIDFFNCYNFIKINFTFKKNYMPKWKLFKSIISYTSI